MKSSIAIVLVAVALASATAASAYHSTPQMLRCICTER